MKATKGSIRINNEKVCDLNLKEEVAVLSQENAVPKKLKVKELILFKRNLSLFIMNIVVPVMIFFLMSSILVNSYQTEEFSYALKFIMISMSIYASISFSINFFTMVIFEDRNSKWFDFISMKPVKICH